MGFRAIVRNGRVQVDEPTQLPDGTVLDLVIADEGDDLLDADRERLHQALHESREQAAQGQTLPAAEALQKLKDRHRK